MRITFISPYYSNIWESLGIGYIASYCKRNFRGELDLNFFHGNFDEPSTILKESAVSDIVAISSTSPTYRESEIFASYLKNTNSNAKVVLGGWHPTVSEDIDFTLFDQIVIGEGEKAFLSILNGNEDKIIYGESSDFIDLPWPDREFINQERQIDYCYKICGERIASFQSRRGCMNNCSMCGEHKMSGSSPVRVRDNDDLLDEINYVIIKERANRIKFLDPTWGYPKRAAISFCEKYLEREETFKWEAMTHAAYLTKDIMKLLKRANCDQLNIGCESGDQRILNSIRKGVTVEKIKEVFRWGKDLGINMRAFFIVGFPEEDLASVCKTRQLIKELDPDVFGCTILCPYPGTDFYTEEFKDIDWSEQGEYSNDIWSTKYFSNEALHDIQMNLNIEFNDKLVSHQKK